MKNIIDVIRGIPTFVVGRDNVKRGIVTPKHIYNISKVYTQTYMLSKKHRLIGVVSGNEFNICYDIRLSNGQTAFGYFISHDSDGNYQVQTIDGFNKFTYEPYHEVSYPLGNTIDIKETEIKEAVYEFRDLFYTEFKD